MMLVGSLAACSNGPGSDPTGGIHPIATRSPGASPAFVAFEPGKHDRLLVVDTATGRVKQTATGPGSESYAASLTLRLVYLPVEVSNCRLAVLRVPLTTASPRHSRRVAVVRGGPIDDVEAQPALSSDGSHLAVLVASPPSVNSGMGPTCGDTDRIAIVSVRRGSVHYVSGRAGEQLDDLAWDGSKLLVRVTSPFRPATSHVVLVGAKTLDLSAASTILTERHGRPGPVFRWHSALAVVQSGELHRVADGHVIAKPLGGIEGLPNSVVRVSVAAHGALLMQTRAGSVYWSNGKSVQQVPVTIAGRWDEPSW